MSRWYRAYVGTVSDPKLGEAALIARSSRGVVIAAWHFVLESAAEYAASASQDDRGTFTTTARRIAASLGEPVAKIERVLAAFDMIGLTVGDRVVSWSKRQHPSDLSTDRVRAFRRRERQDASSGNGDETVMQRPETVSRRSETVSERLGTLLQRPETTESESEKEGTEIQTTGPSFSDGVLATPRETAARSPAGVSAAPVAPGPANVALPMAPDAPARSDGAASRRSKPPPSRLTARQPMYGKRVQRDDGSFRFILEDGTVTWCHPYSEPERWAALQAAEKERAHRADNASRHGVAAK